MSAKQGHPVIIVFEQSDTFSSFCLKISNTKIPTRQTIPGAGTAWLIFKIKKTFLEFYRITYPFNFFFRS